MSGNTPDTFLRLVSRLVPASHRADWVREWQAEIAYQRQPAGRGGRRGRRSLASHLVGAAQHALWLRLAGGTTAVPGPRANMFTGLTDDVRMTLRGWRRAPIFSVTVLATLALGIGLFSAVLSFADGYLFRPLPFPGADRTYYVRDPNASIASALSSADVAALRQSPIATFGFVEWSSSHSVTEMDIDGRRLEVFPYEVGAEFRKTLALPLAAGRDFTPSDHARGGDVAAWLSYRFWLREFDGDWSVVDRRFPGSGPRGPVGLRIVGILGREVSTLDLNNRPPDLVVAAQGPRLIGPNVLAFPIVMLPVGTTIEQGAAEIAAVLQNLSPAKDGRPRAVRLTSFAAAQVAGGRPTAKLLFVGAALTFVLAAMNIVHLLLGRGAVRAREVRTRIAVGASRWRIVRAFLVESVLLGGAGTAAGLFLGWLLSAFIATRVPQLPTGARNLAMVPTIFDARVLAISALLGLAAAVVAGLWSAMRAWRGTSLAGAKSNAISPGLARFILASELTVVTMVMAGVVFASLGVHEYLNRPLGYEYVDRAQVYVQLPGKRLAGTDAAVALEAVRSVAGVRAAGLEAARAVNQPVSVTGRPVENKDLATLAIAEGLFEAWGMTIRSGRWFEPADFSSRDVAVVDERFARSTWPEGAIGQTLQVGEAVRTVVGVVASQRWRLEVEPSPTVFLPSPETSGRSPIVVWAPGRDADELRTRITSAIVAALPGARVTVTPITFQSLFARSAGEAYFQIPVVISFGALSGILALVGVFGIVAFLVQQRTREFAIRIAIGATRLDVARSVLRTSVVPALAGLATGLMGAWISASAVESTVFGWKASGLQTILLVAVAILGVAVLAALAPAVRATRTDPAASLRVD
jgi:putative ABC transport system permease protein